jgi:hypothetical protein
VNATRAVALRPARTKGYLTVRRDGWTLALIRQGMSPLLGAQHDRGLVRVVRTAGTQVARTYSHQQYRSHRHERHDTVR